ncbi:MAG: EAL domain-containing protein [Paraburkholderia sp.]|uniref:EAL domain-containing protein n=1 Tax=Paraburkholderia sp. TaxID=1926495 RepID=UPI0012163B9D|nr:EAL domain-containing protein [Paraburkholderia sp.]TAM06872.1 MAG: EAL domain-containing protein [Paraburkholderia sp.]TAM28878.1 MAG: EAL domain-containing protein [Paraburkholderia sp.]
MQTLIEALNQCAVLVVNQFYEELSRLPKSRLILEMLSPDEVVHLKSKQIQNLLALSDPDLTADGHAEMALRIGRIHAIVGLDKEELVRSRGILQELLFKLISKRVSGESLSLYASRLTTDLAWQLKAYQNVQDSQQEVLLRVTRLVWEAGSYTNFIDDLVEVLSAHDEIAASIIGRPDEHGFFHFEAGAGAHARVGLLEALTDESRPISVRADNPLGQSAVGRAWRNGKAERVLNYQTDPLVERWRELARREGLRSAVAIPIAAQGQSPMAILVLFSALPGGFIGPHQVAFIELLQTLLGCAAMRLQTQDGKSHAVPVSVRQHWAALVRTDGLEMYYQPLLNLRTWQVGKAEALARLHDGGRVLTPDAFLSSLASDDLLALYTHGLDEALTDRKQWLRDNLDLEISINLPPAALNDIRYFEATSSALAAHACAPTKLTLEVLENESLSLSQGQCAILDRFRGLGVLLAQDDLGSGHSGLARLRELPFDWIKIDREIVRIDGDGALDVLRFIFQLTHLGHALGKLVLAEGIDTIELVHALSILGVDGAQGYVIARPMEAGRMREWMANQPSWPVAPRSESVLARLARFVLWEERVALISAVPGAGQRLLDAPHGRRTDDPAVDEFARSLTEFDDILPSGNGHDAVRQALLRTLLTEGRNSGAYRSAVRQLMTAIGHAASV